MLYDPKWEKPEVKADPFSLESLIAWLEKQPADEAYDFTCWGKCMLAQWVQSIDPDAREAPVRDHGYQYLVGGKVIDLSQFRRIASNLMGGGTHWTFGAALARARAALAASSAPAY